MNVEIGAEGALFPEKEYISGIFIAVRCFQILNLRCTVEGWLIPSQNWLRHEPVVVL
jgi:hypothetical protein